jgi:hypothetical protein
MGLGEETTVRVDASGGNVVLSGRQSMQSGVATQIEFPPTAIASPTDVTLIETAIPPPHDLLDWSPVYRVEPLGLALHTPTPVMVPWSNLSGSTFSTQALSLWFSPDGGCFTRVSDSYTNAGFEQGSITTLGYFIVAMARNTATETCP